MTTACRPALQVWRCRRAGAEFAKADTASTTVARTANFSHSSCAHCLRRLAGQINQQPAAAFGPILAQHQRGFDGLAEADFIGQQHALLESGCAARIAPPRSDGDSDQRWHRTAIATGDQRRRRRGAESAHTRSIWRGRRRSLNAGRYYFHAGRHAANPFTIDQSPQNKDYLLRRVGKPTTR
jgi:hypothetical protein